MIYLDANATDILRPEARAALLDAADLGGNASSIHAAGRSARRVLDQARAAVKARLNAGAAEIVFTSGGTEADALAIHALGRGRRVIIGATEHDAVRAAAKGAEILPVDGNGVADLDALRRLLEGPPALVCLMLANNETGTLQPVAAAARLCWAAGAFLFVDAAQVPGRMAVDVSAIGAHALAISGHKLGAVPGVGALLLEPGIAPLPLLAGGGQERGWRGGTHALPAIAALGAACTVPPSNLAPLRDALEAGLPPEAVIIARDVPRLPNTACLALPGVSAQVQVINLDLAGIAVSAGAACSSGKVTRSHVLDAMGLTDLSPCAIRVSLPWNATAADVSAFHSAYRQMARRLCHSAA
ncbi:MAG: cysteine desulfurase family protein [Acetobacteraceae bacterium]|nr:cysteine desulfurase family protein [Acetobacteraceae bacterium]